jgi:hypothetical protein
MVKVPPHVQGLTTIRVRESQLRVYLQEAATERTKKEKGIMNTTDINSVKAAVTLFESEPEGHEEYAAGLGKASVVRREQAVPRRPLRQTPLTPDYGQRADTE